MRIILLRQSLVLLFAIVTTDVETLQRGEALSTEPTQEPFVVQIFAEDAELQTQWMESLRDPMFRVLTDQATVSAAAELVLADKPLEMASVVEAPQVFVNAPVLSSEELIVQLPSGLGIEAFRLLCQFAASNTRLQRRLHQQQLENRSITESSQRDPVTGLPNRVAWEQEFPNAIQRAKQNRQSICLAICDVDGFKRVNDEFGHTIGDNVLAQIGQHLASNLRTYDFVARLGGDEFGLLLTNLPSSAAAAVVQRIQSSCVVGLLPTTEKVTVSIGYCCNGDERSPPELFHAADQALLAAKRAGKNRVCEAGN